MNHWIHIVCHQILIKRCKWKEWKILRPQVARFREPAHCGWALRCPAAPGLPGFHPWKVAICCNAWSIWKYCINIAYICIVLIVLLLKGFVVFQKVFRRKSTSYCMTSVSITGIPYCRLRQTSTCFGRLVNLCQPHCDALAALNCYPNNSVPSVNMIGCHANWLDFSLANCARIWGRPALSWAISSLHGLRGPALDP